MMGREMILSTVFSVIEQAVTFLQSQPDDAGAPAANDPHLEVTLLLTPKPSEVVGRPRTADDGQGEDGVPFRLWLEYKPDAAFLKHFLDMILEPWLDFADSGFDIMCMVLRGESLRLQDANQQAPPGQAPRSWLSVAVNNLLPTNLQSHSGERPVAGGRPLSSRHARHRLPLEQPRLAKVEANAADQAQPDASQRASAAPRQARASFLPQEEEAAFDAEAKMALLAELEAEKVSADAAHWPGPGQDALDLPSVLVQADSRLAASLKLFYEAVRRLTAGARQHMANLEHARLIAHGVRCLDLEMQHARPDSEESIVAMLDRVDRLALQVSSLPNLLTGGDCALRLQHFKAELDAYRTFCESLLHDELSALARAKLVTLSKKIEDTKAAFATPPETVEEALPFLSKLVEAERDRDLVTEEYHGCMRLTGLLRRRGLHLEDDTDALCQALPFNYREVHNTVATVSQQKSNYATKFLLLLRRNLHGLKVRKKGKARG